MGMASSDDEGYLAEQDALLKWAREFPRHPSEDCYEYQDTEDSRAYHEDAVRKHVARKPKTRTGYEKERR